MTKKDQSNIEFGDMVVFRKPKSYILMGRVFEVVSVNEEGFYELMSSFGWSVPAADYEITKYPAEINDTSYLDRIGFTKDKLTGECSFIWEKTEQGHDYWLKFFTGQMSDIEARAAQWVIDFLEKKYADELGEECMMSSDPLEDAWKELEAIGQSMDTATEQKETDIKRLSVPTKSDGGPSSYYDFKDTYHTLNDWMEDKAKEQWGAYSLHMKDLIKGATRFGTKDGVGVGYDINKMLYSAIRMKVMEVGKEDAVEYIKKVLDDKQFKCSSSPPKDIT